MADLYGQVLVGDGISTYTVGANNRKAAETYQVGTRDLVFLQINVTCPSGNLDTTPTAANSNFANLVKVLQLKLELYGVGAPDGNNVTVITTRDSMIFDDDDLTDPGDDVTVLENFIEANSSFTNVDVYWGQLDGWSIENDC